MKTDEAVDIAVKILKQTPVPEADAFDGHFDVGTSASCVLASRIANALVRAYARGKVLGRQCQPRQEGMNEWACNKVPPDAWQGPECLRGKCCCDCELRLTVRRRWGRGVRGYVCRCFDAIDHNRVVMEWHEHGICEMWTTSTSQMTTQGGKGE